MSLYESLVHAFGWMKFKVRIITNSARYGINIYVVADVEIAYVIKSIVYTGNYKVYSSTTNTEYKATIWVVKSLCEPFTRTYHIIYIDRFYTLMDLLIELYDMSLFATETCTKNHIPKELTMTKRSL